MILVDNRTEREKQIDEWLPITSSRNAKWWYSAFHNVTAMVGAGVLGLPYALAHLGWGPGLTILFGSWIVTVYTLWQMVEMHEIVPGKRFDRYHELGQHAFGEKLGLFIVVPQQLIVEVGCDIVYMVTAGQSLKKFHELVCQEPCKDIKLTYFIMIFASVQFFLSHLPNFNSITGISLAAAIMSITYSTIAWAAAVKKGVQPDVDYGYKATTTSGTIFSFFNGLGALAFAYAGHNVVLEIQATIPSTPEKPSKGPMWKGVFVAYLVVAFCYFPVAIVGYWAYGNKVADNVMLSLEKPVWLIASANIFVVVHVIGSYQVYAMPVFDMIETLLVKKLRFTPSFMLRFITRNLYVAFTMIVGICVPFFGGLLGFFGGFAFAPTTYFLPCIIWLIICKPKKWSLTWIINWICIFLGVIIMQLIEFLQVLWGLENMHACHFTLSKLLNFGVAASQRSSNLRFSYKCSSKRAHMENNHHSDARGALIVLEGLDRSGKTSQSGRLVSYLNGLGYPVESWRFPDRDTAVGKMISSYLSNQSQLDDHTIHLLFSANRWEKRSLMEAKLKSGTSLIVDRYSYSGVAFSSAKGLDIEWCKAPEVGLLAPDLVVYLDIPPEKAAERGGYGGERYEKLEFQKNVAQYYKKLSDASWKIIDACQPMEDVEKQLKEIVLDCVKSCQNGKSVSQLWSS
ncbi:hypothetical protein L1987_36518 [Smallanthus sonchifolius]|uniref:Uncharacterized protein n=1 Tax=Smallanthus sonchifolius TaxID=185202 RepID=A0ACB9HFH3_9ASTR|nr:hypothetical protein L1987_36518 [Smallanthus sonchifolius]